MPLEPEDQCHLDAVEGYCTLGLYEDATAELELIEPRVRHVPEVLTVRLEVCRALKQWELMRTVARKLCNYDPDDVQSVADLAFAKRRADSIHAATAILLEAVERHPKAAIFSTIWLVTNASSANWKPRRRGCDTLSS